jgi:hypothetical protein
MSELRDMVNDLAKSYMDVTRTAFDSGYEAGYKAALAAMESRLTHLSENTRQIIEASREPALTRLQAG